MEESSIQQSMQRKIRDGIPNIIELQVMEDAAKCNGSYNVLVVSPHFEGKGPLDRHREILKIVDEDVKKIHAISIKAWTEKQWLANKDKPIF